MIRRHQSLRLMVDGVVLRRINRREVLRRLMRDVVVVIYHNWLLVTVPTWRRIKVTGWLKMRLRLSCMLVAV
jgi:hypothetical protein